MNYIIPLTSGAMAPLAVAYMRLLNGNFILDPTNIAEQIDDIKDLVITEERKRQGVARWLWAVSLLTTLSIFRKLDVHSDKRIVIVNGEFFPSIVAFVMLSRLSGFNVSVCWHDVSPHPGKIFNYVLWFFSALSALCASQVVVHSRHYKVELEKYVVFRNRVKYIPHPSYEMREITFEVKSSSILENICMKDKKYSLFVGRIEYYKGLHQLIPVFIKNKNRILVIAGIGSGAYLEQIKAQIHMEQNIYLIDRYLDEKDFLSLIKDAGSIILPYLQASQSYLPFIAAEMGTPIIIRAGTGLSGCSEYLGVRFYSTPAELELILNNADFAPPAYSKYKHRRDFVTGFMEL